MSLFLIAIVVIFVIVVFSQFGGRLMARTSLTWALVAAFLLLAVVAPGILLPVAHWLGIELVSNFVLASMVCILFFQMIEMNSMQTTSSRKLRKMTSTLTANQFKPVSEPPLPGRRALVIMPCYNEEENIPRLVESIAAMPQPADLKIDFCIINDGSMDGSAALLQQLVPGRFVSHPVNIGVAGVLMTGFELVQRFGYDYGVQCDSDGQHPVAEIPRLLREASHGTFDLLIASRFKDAPSPHSSNLASTTATRRAGSLIISALIRLFWPNAYCTDPTSGFRVYSRNACSVLAREMPDEYPEPESIPILASRRLKIGEISVRMAPRMGGTSSIDTWGSVRYMIKIIGALTGLRLRRFLSRAT